MKFVLEKNEKPAADYDRDKKIAEMSYSASESIWIIDGTKVDPEYRGQKIGQQLLQVIVETARKEGLFTMPPCSPLPKRRWRPARSFPNILRSGN